MIQNQFEHADPLKRFMYSHFTDIVSPQKKFQKAIHPFVTISRQTGAGGMTIGTQLADFMSKSKVFGDHEWVVFEKNLISKTLEEHHLPSKFEKYMPEDTVSLVRDTFEELLGLHPPQFKLVKQTAETILHLSHVGYVVLVGRAANVITSNMEGGVHVRLVSEMAQRVQKMAQQLNISEEKSKAFIKSEDDARAKYMAEHYGKNIDDPLLYDMLIHTDRVNPITAIKMIAEQIQSKIKI